MDRVVDFTGCKRIFRNLGGTDRKFIVQYEGKNYMLKFPDERVPRTDMTTSHTNNITSEYVSSHISKTMNMPTHNTLLGFYDEYPVVACEDFRGPGDENMEFQEFVRALYNSHDVKRVIRLDQIYTTLADESAFSEDLRRLSIERYWDTFVIDALIGNFDRHIGNWGYLSNNGELRLAPVYDYGSSMLPALSDDGIEEIINTQNQLVSELFGIDIIT